MSQQEKKEVIISDWSAGIARDIDSVDAPPNSLYNATNLFYRDGYLESIEVPAVTLLSTGDYGEIGNAFEMSSKYTPDNAYASAIGLDYVKYLYFFDETNKIVRRAYDIGSGYTIDNTFSIDLSSAANPKVGFFNIGEFVYVYGTDIDGYQIISPYKYEKFNGMQSVDGWLVHTQTAEINGGVGVEPPDGFNDIHINIQINPSLGYSTDSVYKTGDIVNWYASTIDIFGYESKIVEIGSNEFNEDNMIVNAVIYAQNATPNGIMYIRLYKKLNNGAIFFFADIHINDGVIIDESKSGFVYDDPNWVIDSQFNTNSTSVYDTGIYNTPKSYISNRYIDGNNDYNDMSASGKADTQHSRLLVVGQKEPTDVTPLSALYISYPNKPGDIYENSFISIDKVLNEPPKSVESFGGYILIIFENMSVILDASHPMPENWRVLSTLYGGAKFKEATTSNDNGVVFADNDSIRLFNGKIQNMIASYNRDFYREFVANATMLSIGFDYKYDVFIITKEDSAIMIDKAGRMSILDTMNNHQLFERINKNTAYLSVAAGDPDDYLYMYELFRGSTRERSSVESNFINLGDNRDKMLFSFNIKLNSFFDEDIDIEIYNEDGQIYSNTHHVVVGDNDIEIKLKERFKRIKYAIEFSGKLKEVSILINARRQNRYD